MVDGCGKLVNRCSERGNLGLENGHVGLGNAVFVFGNVKCGVGLVCFGVGNGKWRFENGGCRSVYLAFWFGFVCFTIVFPVLMKKISRIMVLEMTDKVVWELVFSSHETGF